MHGCGNDYIFVDLVSEPQELAWPRVARVLSDRHFGIGSDGLILIKPSATADFSMVMFNADGSEGEMCGNGMRCLAKYVYEHGLTRKHVFAVETKAGLIKPKLFVEDGQVKLVELDMGKPTVGEESTLNVKGMTLTYIPVSTGNPHCVIFGFNPDEVDLTVLGPAISSSPAFPKGVNVEFAQQLEPGRIAVRVWERGSGETLACGTGACAVGVAAMAKHKCGNEVTISLKGGNLSVKLREDGHVLLRGPAVEVFSGQISAELWREINESS